jgi:predicted transcriptional regulator
MQWGEIWTPGVHDTVVGGVILAVTVGALGLAWAWVRNWRMRNPWVWLVSILKEDAGLNFGGFCCALVLIASMTLLLGADLSPRALNISAALGVTSFLMFSWFFVFVRSTEVGSARGLFYRHKADAAVPNLVTKATTDASNLSSLPPVPPTIPTIKASHLNRAIKQGHAGDLDRYFDRNCVEFNVIKALYQTQGQPGLTVESICLMRELRTVDVKIALNDLGAAGVVEQRDEQLEPTYRLTEAGLALFRRWMRTPNRC